MAGLFGKSVPEQNGFDVEVLDLSRLASEYGRNIHPCKACFSTAAALCHWPCSCYPNHSLGQTQDWMNEIYPMWVAAHGVMIVTPVNWYHVTSSLKLMMDRLVCADGGNPDPTRLEAWARSLVPNLGEIKYRWSGQVLDSVDYLPFSGKNPNDSIFIHTGDSGEGLTNGVIGSLVLRDLVRRRKNRRAWMLDPGRITAKAAGRFVSENATVASNLTEHLTSGEVSSADELKRREAALIRQGAKKVAAYRDQGGKLHLRSATCTHSGCVLHWNSFETCWDCTCDGSHFSVDGDH